MTQQRDIERLLDDWFSDGPDQAPDRVVDIVTDRIERQSQRPAWRLQWRSFPVNAQAKIAVAAAAVLIVAVVGYNLLPGRSTGVGGPTPSAHPTPSIVPSASLPAPSIAFPDWFTEGSLSYGRGILAAGSHTSRLFRPGLSFAIPDGWVNSQDIAEWYVLFPDTPANETEYGLARDTAQAIYVTSGPTAGALAICPGSVEEGAGATVAEIVDTLAASERLATTGRTAVTIGDLSGQQIDIRLDPGWTGSCPLEPEDPPTRDYKGVRDRVILLDIGGGRAVSIVIYSMYAADFAPFLEEAMPIVESFQFDVTP